MTEETAPTAPDVPSPTPVQVQIPEQHATIAYSDQAFVYFTPVGFTLDFAQLTPQANMSRIVSRVGMSATHLKLLAQVLADNLQRYEQQFGEVLVTPKMVEEHPSVQHTIGFHPGADREPKSS